MRPLWAAVLIASIFMMQQEEAMWYPEMQIVYNLIFPMEKPMKKRICQRKYFPQMPS
eukprot:SAG11_NODE_1047_length_6040_cov_3.805588_4_plen_57_part_00